MSRHSYGALFSKNLRKNTTFSVSFVLSLIVYVKFIEIYKVKDCHRILTPKCPRPHISNCDALICVDTAIRRTICLFVNRQGACALYYIRFLFKYLEGGYVLDNRDF